MKSETMTIRLPPEIKAAAQEASAAERRSLSSIAEIALAAWLSDHGYLGKKPRKRSSTSAPRTPGGTRK